MVAAFAADFLVSCATGFLTACVATAASAAKRKTPAARMLLTILRTATPPVFGDYIASKSDAAPPLVTAGAN